MIDSASISEIAREVCKRKWRYPGGPVRLGILAYQIRPSSAKRDTRRSRDKRRGMAMARSDPSIDWEEDVSEDGTAEADVAMAGVMHDAADDPQDEEIANLQEEDALAVGTTNAVLEKLGLHRKTFQCDIHHICLTNLGRYGRKSFTACCTLLSLLDVSWCASGSRRRDVQVIFTLGALPGEGGAATLKEVLPSADAEISAPGITSVLDAPPALKSGPEQVEGEGGTAKKNVRRLAVQRAPLGRKGRAAVRGDTSKPVVFKTDVAVKVERGRTAALKRKFHGTWTGKYHDLSHRVLHMTLVEQTRFGNLVELGTNELSLIELATGSVQQEVTFAERDGRTTVESYRLNFHVHFQVRASPVDGLHTCNAARHRSARPLD